MSRAVEKSIGGFLNALIGSSNLDGNTFLPTQSCSIGQGVISFGLINYVEKLEAARKISKQAEEELISIEYQEWVRQASLHSIDGSVIADYLQRSLIAFSRGHYFTNLHINSIKLTESDKLWNKKIGYLYISRTLPPGSDLSMLLVNSVQKDLASNHITEIALGLSLVPVILNADISPVIATSLVTCMGKHQEYARRRAAVMVSVLASNSVDNPFTIISACIPSLLQLLSDSDPAIAIAATSSLCTVYKVTSDVEAKDEIRDKLAVCSSNIIMQAVEGSLPLQYDVGSTHAPFVQVQMLRVLQVISTPDWKAPDGVISAVYAVLSQPWGGRDLTLYMTFYEGILTAASVHTEGSLTALSLKIILGFLKSSYLDFKYLGIKILGETFVVWEESLTQGHLEAVLECLYSSSRLLQLRTVHLLCSMANQSNYQAICTTLMQLSQLSGNQSTFRGTILNHIANILKRLSLDLPWCIEFLTSYLVATTMDSVIQTTQKLLSDALISTASNAVNRASSEDDRMAVASSCDKFFGLVLDLENLSLVQVNTIASLLNLIFISDAKKVNELLVKKFLLNVEKVTRVSEELMECLVNCGLRMNGQTERVLPILEKFSLEKDVYYCFRIKEKISLLKNDQLTKRILQKQSKILSGDYVPDWTLSFYDSYLLETASSCDVKLFEPTSLPSKGSKQTINQKKNPFDTQSCPTLLTADHDLDRLTISGSPNSGATPASASSWLPGTSSRKSHVWTTKGRLNQHTEVGVLEIEATAENIENNQKISTESCSFIEIAHEANELILNEPSPDKVSANVIIETQKSDLTKALLKGLGIGKE